MPAGKPKIPKRRIAETAPVVFAVLVLVVLSAAMVANAMTKELGRDEQMYCTAGVLLARGKLIYRDFAYPSQLPYHPLLLAGLFLSAFSAAGVLSREIDNKTALTVISKPISRPLFIAGKYAGLMGALAVAMWLCFLMFLLTQRHAVLQMSSDPWDMPVIVFGFGAVAASLGIAAFCNYYYGTEFSSTAVGLAVLLLTLAVILAAFWGRTWERQEMYGA